MAKKNNAASEETMNMESAEAEATQEAETTEPVAPVSAPTGHIKEQVEEGTLGDLKINYSVPVGRRGNEAIAILQAQPKVQTMIPILSKDDGEFLEGNYQSLGWVVPRGKLVSLPAPIAAIVNEHVASLLVVKQKERATRS